MRSGLTLRRSHEFESDRASRCAFRPNVLATSMILLSVCREGTARALKICLNFFDFENDIVFSSYLSRIYFMRHVRRSV